MPMDREWMMMTSFATLSNALEAHELGEFTALLGSFSFDKVEAQRLVEVHQALREQALQRADRAFALVLQWLLSSTNFDAVATQSFRETTPKRWVNKGTTEVEVV